MGKRPEDSQMQHPLLTGNAAWDKDYKTEIKKIILFRRWVGMCVIRCFE